MRDVSARWRANIGGVNRWVTEIRWSNDGGKTWGYADLISGSVTADSTSQIRWTCNLELINVRLADETPLDPTEILTRKGINPFTTRLRIRHGIAWSRTESDRETIGMGLYKVMTADRDSDSGGIITVTGDSFERYVINARFTKPRKAPRESAFDRLSTLISEVLPQAYISWRPGVSDRILPAMLFERDRWALVDGGAQSGSVAKSLGGRCYCNGDGVFIVAPTPALTDPVVWEAQSGPGGVLIKSTESLSDESTYNVVSASGGSTDEDAPVVPPQVIGDEDPQSLTYWLRTPDEGGYGIKPFFYSSQMITTTRQARIAARSRLADLLGLRQQVTFDSLHDPTKEPGDVGTVTDPDGHKEKVILDAVTYDLLGGPLSATTRTTQTRLAGDASQELAEDVEESG